MKTITRPAQINSTDSFQLQTLKHVLARMEAVLQVAGSDPECQLHSWFVKHDCGLYEDVKKAVEQSE